MAWERPPLSINDDVHNPHPTSRLVCIGSKNETQNRSPEGKGKPSKSLKGGIHELNNVFTSHICFPHAVRTTLSTPLAHPAIGSTVEIFHLAGQTCRKIAGENFAALSTLHFQPVATKRRRRHPNLPFRRSRARSPTTSEAVERLHFQKKCQMTRAMGIEKLEVKSRFGYTVADADCLLEGKAGPQIRWARSTNQRRQSQIGAPHPIGSSALDLFPHSTDPRCLERRASDVQRVFPVGAFRIASTFSPFCIIANLTRLRGRSARFVRGKPWQCGVRWVVRWKIFDAVIGNTMHHIIIYVLRHDCMDRSNAHNYRGH